MPKLLRGTKSLRGFDLQDRFPALIALEERLHCHWLNVRKAISESTSKIANLQTMLFSEGRTSVSPGASFVCFGSLARGEWTYQSDLDWIMLVEQGTEEEHSCSLQALTDRLNETKEIGPAPGGIFGNTVFVSNLASNIKGPPSVKALSLRLLVLLESIAVGDDDVRNNAVHEILAGYLMGPNVGPAQAEYISERLFDDIASFGRTMAVDLKEHEEQDGQKWGLRNIKRRFSRKLIISTGSLACLRWKKRCTNLRAHSRPAHDAVEYFESYLARPPLEILASEVTQAGISDPVSRRLFDAYDQFLGILDDADSREHLERLPRYLADTSPLFRRVRAIGQEFEGDLNHLLNLTSEK